MENINEASGNELSDCSGKLVNYESHHSNSGNTLVTEVPDLLEETNCQGSHPPVEENGLHKTDNPDSITKFAESVPNSSSDPDILCGFTKNIIAPKCMQGLANKHIFLLLYCVAYILQGMYYTYFVSVLTTIERLFQIRSKTTGIIMSATEIGQIGGGLFLSYFGGRGHRPKWMACGILLFSICSFICALPHFLFSDNLHHEMYAEHTNNFPANLCSISVSNNTLSQCETEGSNSIYVLVIFFVALLGVGIGQTALHNLGIPYIDDNVNSEESPSYFGTTIGVRIFGPTLGFVVGSLCTRIYVYPFEEVNFGPTDSRWIGAWWLGLLIISLALAVTSFMMAWFPKKLPQQTKVSSNRTRYHPLPVSTVTKPSSTSLKQDLCQSTWTTTEKQDNHAPCQMSTNKSESLADTFLLKDISSKHTSLLRKLHVCFKNKKKTGKPSDRIEKVSDKNLADFLKALKRLLGNKVLLSRTASSVFHLLPIAGLYTFLPKYLETQFRLPVHSAAMVSGTGGILVMGLGIFSSGLIIRKLNPSPRKIASWIACTAALYSIGMFILMFVEGCSHEDIEGYDSEQRYSNKFMSTCDRNCSCDDNQFAPVCTKDGRTFFSACLAGCSSVRYINGTANLHFANCECLDEGIEATLGLCNVTCPNVVLYMVIFCTFVVIHSTSEVGGMMLTLRCVDKKDKSLALGLISVAIGIFGNVPCPILYGSVIDSSCLHWRSLCNGQGACQVYNNSSFRYVFHGTTGLVMILAFISDILVWKFAEDIVFKDVSPNHERETPNLVLRENNKSLMPYHHDKEKDNTLKTSGKVLIGVDLNIENEQLRELRGMVVPSSNGFSN